MSIILLTVCTLLYNSSLEPLHLAWLKLYIHWSVILFLLAPVSANHYFAPYIYEFEYFAAKSPQSCPTLCSPIDGSPPGSPVPEILQARTLEWVAISFSNAWKWKVKVKSLSHVRLLATPWTAAHQDPPSMGFFQARVLEWGAIAFSDVYV